MPKTPRVKAGVAPLPEEEFLRESATPLTLDERQQLRAFFGSELWKKVWRNALTKAPNSAVPEANPQLTGILANNRLHQMQGWEKLRKALAEMVEDKPVPAPRPPENYPHPLEIETR